MEVVAKESRCAEEGVHALAIRGASGRSVRVPGVNGLFGEFYRGRSLPHDFAGLAFDAKNESFRAGFGRGGHENAIAQDDGRLVARAGQVDLPFQVLVRAPA